jgi:hypothetical protein
MNSETENSIRKRGFPTADAWISWLPSSDSLARQAGDRREGIILSNFLALALSKCRRGHAVTDGVTVTDSYQ